MRKIKQNILNKSLCWKLSVALPVACLSNAWNSSISQIIQSLLIRYQELYIHFSDYKHFSNKFNNFRWLKLILCVHIPQLDFLRNSLFMKIGKWEFKTWWKIITSNKEKENVCWKAKLNVKNFVCLPFVKENNSFSQHLVRCSVPTSHLRYAKLR